MTDPSVPALLGLTVVKPRALAVRRGAAGGSQYAGDKGGLLDSPREHNAGYIQQFALLARCRESLSVRDFGLVICIFLYVSTSLPGCSF